LPKSYHASYSQGSTANSVASAISGAINADSTAPVTASVASGSNVITLTAKTPGFDTNYGVTASAATSQNANFSQPSFTSGGTTLSGGADSTASLATPLSTFYTYDAAGNLLTVLQGQQTRTYKYDGLGQITSSCIPETNNQCTTYTYTPFGALATKADPRSITVTYGYDNWNRVQTIAYSDGTPTVTYAYGAPGAATFAAGRLTRVSLSVPSTGVHTYDESYTYDNIGRITQLVKTIGGRNYSISYHYTGGLLDSVTYPSGRVVSQGYDPISRLNQVATGGTTVLSIGSFNAANQILTSTYGNGIVRTNTYNSQLQLSSIQSSLSGTQLMNLAYSYGGGGDNGQISGIVDAVSPAQSTAYFYDELGRIKIAQTVDVTSANTWKLKFTYDRYGNRISQIPVAGTASMPVSQVVTDPRTNWLSNQIYDADGNVINDSLHSYIYNGAGQLTGVDGATNIYAYDASGLRVQKNNTVYIYNGNQSVAEYSNGVDAGSPNIEHIYAGDRRVSSISAGVFTYLYSDHLSTRVQIDSSGLMNRTFGHFPFGETWYETGNANKTKFTIYERDSDSSGLDYANARYYSSRTGTFGSVDPYLGSIQLDNPQSLNRYSYALNDPVNLIDPSGLDFCKWDDGSSDDPSADGGATATQCLQDGGSWVSQTTVDVPGGNPNCPATALSCVEVWSISICTTKECDPAPVPITPVVVTPRGPDQKKLTAAQIQQKCHDAAFNFRKSEFEQWVRSMNAGGKFAGVAFATSLGGALGYIKGPAAAVSKGGETLILSLVGMVSADAFSISQAQKQFDSDMQNVEKSCIANGGGS